MFETWTPPVAPRATTSTAMQLDEKVLQADFGDGYEQTASDGLNSIREAWTLTWPGILDADADAIEAFWRSKGKVTAFWYRVPGRAAAKRFKFTQFERPQVAGHLDGVSVGIREVFDIE